MFKRTFIQCKDYFNFKVDDKKSLIFLFVTALLRTLSLLSFPVTISVLIDLLTRKQYIQSFYTILLLSIFYVLYVVFHHLNYIAYNNASNYTFIKLQEKVLNKVAVLDNDYHKYISKTFLINTVSDDIKELSKESDRIIDLATHFVGLFLAIIILFKVNIFIGIVTSIFLFIHIKCISYVIIKRDYFLKRQRAATDKIVDLYGQILDGNKEVRTFDMKKDLEEHYDKLNKEMKKAYFKKRFYIDLRFAVLPFILYFIEILTYLIFIVLIFKGQAKVATLVLVIGYVSKVVSETEIFNKKQNLLALDNIRVERIKTILNYKPNNIKEFGKLFNDDIFGNVEFDKVCFNIDDKEILKNITLNIKSNRITTLVGKSGSGKSSILKLLLRLYKPTKGNIYIDGFNIYEYSKEVYSSNVSISTQKPFVFNMSIKNNLALVDKNHNNHIKVCKKVGIHNFIMSLPKGYNTIIKEDATDLSGGQKQVLSLARTLLTKSEILVFDEITSSLDPNTTKHIIEVLNELKKNHTIVIVTHKPTLMKISDEIVVMDNGKVKGVGTHKELLKDNLFYQKLQ
jgi:ABC-type multidrug transport system, ATPase and permease components